MPNQIIQPMPPAQAIIGSEAVALSAASGVLVANVVYLYAFEVASPTTISGIRTRVTATATGTSDVGIYNAAGNLLVHTGAVANIANTNQTFNFASNYTLSPGLYYLALTPSNSTDTYNRVTTATNIEPFARIRAAVNAATAGVLPNATGGTAANANTPTLSAVVVGGLP